MRILLAYFIALSIVLVQGVHAENYEKSPLQTMNDTGVVPFFGFKCFGKDCAPYIVGVSKRYSSNYVMIEDSQNIVPLRKILHIDVLDQLSFQSKQSPYNLKEFTKNYKNKYKNLFGRLRNRYGLDTDAYNYYVAIPLEQADDDIEQCYFDCKNECSPSGPLGEINCHNVCTEKCTK